MNEAYELKLGDCLSHLRAMPDNSVDSIVTDPPYGLGKEPDPIAMLRDWMTTGHHEVKGKGFMGKEWDAFVPQPQVWAECFRVLKPGGHLVAFAGTRTQDLMALGLRIAGFEIRDMLGWCYGCLSEDTEILIDGKWEPYHKAIDKGHALCYIPSRDEYQWQPIENLFVYEYDDTAYRITSDRTDQIVSRNHRCLVERGGEFVFQFAEALECEAKVPILESVQDMLVDLPVSNKSTGIEERVLWARLCPAPGEAETGRGGSQRKEGVLCGMRNGGVEARRMVEESEESDMLPKMQRGAARGTIEDARAQGTQRMDLCKQGGSRQEDDRAIEPGLERRSDTSKQERRLCESADQVCQMSGGFSGDGPEGRVCDGTSVECGEGDRPSVDTERVCPPCGPRCDQQRDMESGVICVQRGPQTLRVEGGTKTTVARVRPFHYRGKVWCVKVPSGAFVARRNGKVFVTGNSGFPKSLDISKAIDKAGGGEGMPEQDRQAFASELRQKREAAGITRQQMAEWFPQYQEVTKNWERTDAGFRVPSEPDYQILVDRLGVSEHWRLRVRAEDKRRLLADNLQDRREDGSVIGLGHSGKAWEATTDVARQWQGFGTALKPALETITLARKPLDGTVAETVLKWGTGGLNVDGCRIAAQDSLVRPSIDRRDNEVYGKGLGAGTQVEPQGRFPANLIHDGSDEVVALFPDSKGSSHTRHNTGDTKSVAKGAEKPHTTTGHDDHGSNARFFQSCPADAGDFDPIFYCAKASKKDRNYGCDGLPDQEWRDENTANPNRGDRPFHPSKNIHNTVKPNSLMRWLCRLVTPPGGVILDPYTGSGSTGKAAIEEGFRFIGIELLPEYFPIAQARISKAFDDKYCADV